MNDETLLQLNSEQKMAVEATDGPILIVAGAGTGKTTVITEKIVHLVMQKNIQPEEILALTFTDKAATEMEERVDRRLPYGYYDLWISTFHNFCEKILREHGLDLGLPTDFKLLNELEQWLLLRHNIDQLALDYYRPQGNPTKFLHDLIKHFSRAKDEAISSSDYLDFVENLALNQDGELSENNLIINRKTNEDLFLSEISRLKELAKTYHQYQQLLLTNKSLDFGDLLLYTVKLLEKRPLILKKYQEKFKYILVDEFQDTNYIQYQLIKLLVGKRQNITVVADDDQAIYRWRGASINNVIQFKNDFPHSQDISLVQNYRSGQEILDLAYNFIQLNNPHRLEYQLSQARNIVSETEKLTLNSGMIKPISKKLINPEKLKAEIKVIVASTVDEEGDLIIKKILEKMTTDKNLTWGDFAILVRANDYAKPYISSLEKASIPYIFLSSKGLYYKKIILDLISFLRLLDNYHEGNAMFRVLSMPIFTLTYEEIVIVLNYARKKTLSLYEVLKKIDLLGEVSQESKKNINKILSLITRHSQMARENKKVSEIINSFLFDPDSKYAEFINKQEEKEKHENVAYLNQFLREVNQFEENNLEISLKKFIQNLDLILESGFVGSLTPDWEMSSPDSVKVMTIHAAKGLEFKNVFLPSLVDRRFPSTERKEGIPLPEAIIKELVPTGDLHLEEERRLFYVAITRAKSGLYFTYAKDYGGARDKKPSRFLIEAKILNLEENFSSSISSPLLKNDLKTISVTAHKYQLPYKFSYTQIKTFQTCPAQYKFAHILRLPKKGKYVLTYGNTIHKTLEQFYLLARERVNNAQNSLFKTEPDLVVRNLVSLKDLLLLYDKYWQDDFFEKKGNKETFYKKGKKSLEEFYQNILPEEKVPLYLEWPFNLKIDNFNFSGKIDRIDLIKDNFVRLIDYKTGEKRNKEFTTEDKKQLLLYQLAVMTLTKYQPLELMFYYIDTGEKKVFCGTEKELNKLRKELVDYGERIQKSDFSATPSLLCKYCDYNEICEDRVN